MTFEQTKLDYANKAQSKFVEIVSVIEQQIAQGVDAIDELEKAVELLDFQESLLSSTNPWSEEDTIKWIEYFKDKYNLEEIPWVDTDIYILPQVLPGQDPGSGYVTHADLAAEVSDLEAADAALEERIKALEEYDYSSLIPQELLDDVEQLKSDVHGIGEDLETLQGSVLSNQSSLSSHISNTSVHVTSGEKAVWNAKVSQSELSDGLATKANVTHSHSLSDVTGLQTALNSLQAQINNLPIPQDGEDGATPTIQIGTVSEGEEFAVEIDESSTQTNVILNFTLKKGEKGDGFHIDAIGNYSDRSLYNNEAPGFAFLAQDQGYMYFLISAGNWSGPIAFKGFDGWTPVFGLYTHTESRVLLEITGFMGGTGEEPTLPGPPGSRFFLAPDGYTTIPENAINLKGPKGNQGDRGRAFIIDASGTDRSLYDEEAEGFTFLNTGSGKISWKLGSEPGNWSSEYQWTGLDGTPGKSAYQIWLENGGEGEESDFLNSLKGEDGENGEPGEDGKSAYQIWLDNGGEGEESDFLESLKGEDGKSAYDIWIDNGGEGTEQDFLDSLKGEDGEPGNDGLSAYEIWLNNGGEGDEADFLQSLIGPAGPGVPPGGEDGQVLAKASGEDFDTKWIDAPSNAGVIVVENIDEMNSLTGEWGEEQAGFIVHVKNANDGEGEGEDDPSVETEGTFAGYLWDGTQKKKIYEEEGVDSGVRIITNAISGTNTYTLDMTPALQSYSVGLTLLVRFENTNTGASTLNINGLGAKDIVTRGNTSLVADQLISGKYYMLVYDGERFQVTDIPFVANSSNNKLAYIDNNGRVRLADGSIYNSTAKSWTHTAATNDGTEAVRWNNSNGHLLFRLLSDRVAEFGTSGAAGIEIPTDIASENAYLLINNNQDVGFRILDRNGDVFSDIKTTNGNKRSIFRQPIGKAFTFDFETIIKQVHVLASDDDPGAQNILATVEVPSGYYIHVRLKTAIAWSALGRMISSRPIVAIGFNTGTLEGTAEAPAPIYHGGPANGGFNINFNGSTGEVEIRLENENDGESGYNYVCDLEFEYTLIPIPA